MRGRLPLVKGVFLYFRIGVMVSVATYRGITLFRHILRGVLFLLLGWFMAIKRVVIAGCRNYTNYEEAKSFINNCISNVRKDNTIIIISGGCSGADKIGEQYAKENGFEVELFTPEWDKYGRSAGPKRNKIMAEVSDYVICFWDGKSKGTKSMINFAKLYDKPLRIKKI